MAATARVWMTPQAFERLEQELDHLLGLDAAEEEASTTASADFDQGPVVSADHRAARIGQIRELLRHAVVGEAPADDGVAEPGMVLTVRFADTDETSTFLLSVREASEPGGLDVYSPDSPLGRALWGAREGEERSYTVPSGAVVRVRLLRAVPYGLETA